MKTLKNKLYAIGLLVCGSLGVALENDATALVLFGKYSCSDGGNAEPLSGRQFFSAQK